MQHLRVKVDKYETNEKEILKNIEFIFNKNDRIALVGGNGVGKTTLMKIITGEIKQFDGGIENVGNLSIGYLSQIYSDEKDKVVFDEIKDGFPHILSKERELRNLEKLLEQDTSNMDLITRYTSLLDEFNNIGGYEYKNKIHEVANGMEILDLLDKKLSEISGGERTKVALCKILVESPDILCLDEPTNFIDIGSTEWLESYLQNKWTNGYIIISHDREFLDKTCSKTFELQPLLINFYYTNYSSYVLERGKKEEKQLKDWERQQEYIKKEENLINRFRAGSRASFAKSREKALDRLELLPKPYIPKMPVFYFDYVGLENERVLYFKEAFIGRKEPLFYIDEVQLHKGDRIGIVGENGAGKSTLLKTIIGQLELLDGVFIRGKGIKQAYYSQLHEELDMEKTIRENFEKNGLHLSDQQLIGYLKFYLFDREDIDKKVKYLSGGQKSKVLFAILGQKESNILIFDEPTNHLDYDSREALELAINRYKGSILFISHDRYFTNKIANKLWIIQDNELIVSYGNYEDYKYKLERGLDMQENLYDISDELDLVLIDKLGEKEATRIKKKYSRKK